MDFCALDVETANQDRSSICQIGIVRFRDGKPVAEYEALINPEMLFDPFNTRVHGIGEDDVKSSPTFAGRWPEILDFIAGDVVVSHSSFDKTALSRAATRYDFEPLSNPWLDSAKVVRRVWEQFKKSGYGLKNLASAFDIEFEHHDALADARTCGIILVKALEDNQTDIDHWLSFISSSAGKKYKRYPSKSDLLLKDQQPNEDGPYYGQHILFTGALSIPRHEAQQMAITVGFKVLSSMSKKVDFLVVGDQNPDALKGFAKSSKHRKAEELIAKGHELQILSESDFADWFQAE